MGQVVLEIGLHERGSDRYTVTFRLDRPGDAVDAGYLTGYQPLSNLKRESFLEHALDPLAYGRELSKAVFVDAESERLLTRYAEAAAEGESDDDRRLRVRLIVNPQMPYLHDLRWETMCDPTSGERLFTRDDCLFSRYLLHTDFRYVRPRQDKKLRALLAVASPNDLTGKYQLAPVELDSELERANEFLEGTEVCQVERPVTMDSIVDGLRTGGEAFDILYLVAHGAFRRTDIGNAAKDEERRPRVWLEDDYGDAVVVSGVDLAARISELNRPPMLAVLVSCEGAGTGDDGLHGAHGALAAFGPRLVSAGIPAVVAMQGKVSMETMQKFLPTFFACLCETGQIDLAMGKARGAVRDRPDSWMPVLYMRLNAGRIWTARPRGKQYHFSGWPGVKLQIENRQCTPILGSGLTDHILGSEREVAVRWADGYRYPLASHDRVNLPLVAEYLAITQGDAFPRNALRKYLEAELHKHYGALAGLEAGDSFQELVTKTGKWHRTKSDKKDLEPHKVLASLRCPLYVTTNPDSLMADALADSGVEPDVAVFDWHIVKSSQDRRFARDREDAFELNTDPSADVPLVYHLFGAFSEPLSVVLTQDDYFEYLQRFVENKDTMPSIVSDRLTSTGLLFIGFRLCDWSFRALLKIIGHRGGSSMLKPFKHVAVQIDPETDDVVDPEMARRYLREMGNFLDARVDIYWGSINKFIEELAGQLPATSVDPDDGGA